MKEHFLEWFCDITDLLMDYEEKHPYKFSIILSLITNLIILGIVWLFLN